MPLRSLAFGLRSLLFPATCVGCAAALEGAYPFALCRSCHLRLPRGHSPWVGQLDGQVVVSPFLYRGAIQALIRTFKYQRRRALAGYLGHLLARNSAKALACLSLDGVVPVPLHPVRLRERTFNPAETLARTLSRKLDLPLEKELLVRTRPTRAQTELNRLERTRNVQGAFSLRPGASVRARRLLVVDDVLTTGATAGAAAKVLRRAGASSVAIATLAHA